MWSQCRRWSGTWLPPNGIRRLTVDVGQPESRILYPSHVPTTPVQKIALTVGSAVSVLLNPERTDMLATLGETTDATGIQILKERPRVNEQSINLEALRHYPEESFGKAYANFMDSHGFSPDDRAAVKFVDDPELAYVMQRYRELHDFWHVLLDLPPSVFGEIVLKYIELVQTELPVCALSSFVGPLRVTPEERSLLLFHYIPWASRVGRNSPNLINIYYEKLFDQSLTDLRKRLNIETAPKY